MALEWLVDLLSGGKKYHFSFKRQASPNTKTVIKNKDESVQSANVQYSQTFNGPTVNINIQLQQNGKLDPSVIGELRPLIEGFEHKQVSFMADEPRQLLADISDFESGDSDARGILRFFKSKLPVRDYQLLRTGLYLNHLYESGQTGDVKRIWAQATNSSSQRDRRIIELASAGYFMTFFSPLYKELIRKYKKTQQDAQGQFTKRFNQILDEPTFVIFVPTSLSVDGIVDKVVKKAVSNINYGVEAEAISIHAAGRQQVIRVKSALVILKEWFPDITTHTQKNADLIKVEVRYRNNSLTVDHFSES